MNAQQASDRLLRAGLPVSDVHDATVVLVSCPDDEALHTVIVCRDVACGYCDSDDEDCPGVAAVLAVLRLAA